MDILISLTYTFLTQQETAPDQLQVRDLMVEILNRREQDSSAFLSRILIEK